MTPPLRKKTSNGAWRWRGEAETDLMRTLALRSFWFFFQWVFGAAQNPKGKKWIEESVHKPIADWLQAHVDEWLGWRAAGIVQQKHLAVVIHREVGKTTLISQALQAWLHLKDPEISTYTGSEKLDLAAGIVGPIKAVMDGSDTYSLWTHLFGNWSGNARTWKSGEVVHAARRNTARKDPSLGTFGVETSIVGAHPDAIFLDDPISYERLKSDSDWLERVNDQVSSQIPVLQADGLRIWVGTRYSSQDHFGRALDFPEEGGDGVATLSGMPTDAIRLHPKGIWHVWFMAGRDEKDQPTTPKVWPNSRLGQYKNVNPVRYAAQVMNDPADSEFNPITRRQLHDCIVPAKEVPFSALSYAILCDLAFWDGVKRINKDETVYEVVGYSRVGSGDVYYIEGDGSMYWRDEDLANRIVSLVQRYRRQGRRIIGITNDLMTGGGKGLWHSNLMNYFADVNERMPVHYELPRGRTNKIERISAMVPFWVDGHVKVVENAPGMGRLFAQMERVGEMQLIADKGQRSGRKDDWIDAFADAFHEKLYRPMRRPDAKRAIAYGAEVMEVEGLDVEDWEDRLDLPRPVIR